MITCEHETFEAEINVARFENRTERMADVRLFCCECRRPVRFLGLPTGLNIEGAAVSVDKTEVRLAFTLDEEE